MLTHYGVLLGPSIIHLTLDQTKMLSRSGSSTDVVSQLVSRSQLWIIIALSSNFLQDLKLQEPWLRISFGMGGISTYHGGLRQWPML